MQTMITATPIYAALLALLFIKLTLNVVKARRAARVAIGDGGNPALQRAIAVHNNFAQYVPLGLLLMLLVELQQAPLLFTHALGVALLIARAAHAYGVSQTHENFKIRKYSMLLTTGMLVVSALFLLANSVYLALT